MNTPRSSELLLSMNGELLKSSRSKKLDSLVNTDGLRDGSEKELQCELRYISGYSVKSLKDGIVIPICGICDSFID